jgi:hypothetical protein
MTSNAAADEIQQIIKAERQSNVNDISLPLPESTEKVIT